MNMAKQIQQAEAAIIRSMGIAAVFITHDNQHHPLNVLPKDDTRHTQNNDFRSRNTSRQFEALASDIPNDWRDGLLLLGGTRFNVVDVVVDSYEVRGEIWVE